jgi:hypothetical protein
LKITELELAALRVADHADLYQQDRNPLRAWLAYLECRRHRVAVPAWVLEYFDRVSAALEIWTRRGAPKRLAPAILRTFEMKRAKGTVFTKLKESDRNFVLASVLEGERHVDRHDKQRAKANRVARDAAAYGIKAASRTTVDRAFKKFRDADFNRGRQA